MLRQRMYNLVMYNLSPIQQGIQGNHATVEYANKYSATPEYQQWADIDKVLILLNGGTSNRTGTTVFNNIPIPLGSMEQHIQALEANNIRFAAFNEPDLNNSTSAIAFLCDERVWDKELYPNPIVQMTELAGLTDKVVQLEAYNKKFLEMLTEQIGPEAAFLRVLTQNMRLA
jgi:hypothetical protein